MRRDLETTGLTRRRALHLIGAGAGIGIASALGFQSTPARPVRFPKGAIVRTLLRDVDPDVLSTGATLFHEHLNQHSADPNSRQKFLEDVDNMIDEVRGAGRAGAITKRRPDKEEQRDIEYGRRIAHRLASLDLGQSVAIADGACVALEAMEGTDAMLRRAAGLVEGKRLTLVKASSRRRHMLFDVPVIGPATIEVMQETNTTALAVDAGRTLLLDRDELIGKANRAKIAITGMEPQPEDAGS